jgi:hypothetical protein
MAYELFVGLLVLQLWMPPNTACTRTLPSASARTSGELPVRGARFQAVYWLKPGSVKAVWSCPARQPLTPAVDCNNMCYVFKSSEIAKFSRIFDDSSLQKV